MHIKPAGSRPTTPGSKDYFTGEVQIEPIADASVGSAAKSALVTFARGARTAWHTHPLGQTIYVTAGEGLAQCMGGQVTTIRQGDTVWFPPGEKHWHGASPDSSMTHFAVQEAKDGVTVEWLAQVNDAEYMGQRGI
jgi:quercetin dioxygenase-like cupin family protein